jgi:hypothetical protein
MRTTLEPEDIESIAQRVVEVLKPLLVGNGRSESEDRLLTVKALSEFTGLSRQWIYNNRQKLEPVYLNGKPLFWQSRIKAMLEPEKPKNPKSNAAPIPLRGFKQQNNRER